MESNMNLDFFYVDDDNTVLKERPNDLSFSKAIKGIEDLSMTITEASEGYYSTKMWQWHTVYIRYNSNGPDRSMFDQPTLSECNQELLSHSRGRFKEERKTKIANLKVTVDDMEFDADEPSRARMMSAVVSADTESETVMWALADNSVATVTASQLKQALRLSGKAMESIWFQQ